LIAHATEAIRKVIGGCRLNQQDDAIARMDGEDVPDAEKIAGCETTG
jgi:hypothetical protein